MANEESYGPEDVMVPMDDQKPESGVWTVMLVVSFVLMAIGIGLVAAELNKFYDCSFGGMLSVDQAPAAAPAQPK
jgi:hypothetical protein